VHKEEFRYFYASPNIIIMIKRRRMRWAGHVVLMEEESTQGFDSLDVNGRIILK
jgi:hypothetical protein